MATSGNAQNFHVKSFFAATVKEALTQAHQEMGPDALLLRTREAPPEARHLGAFEAVLGVAREAAAKAVTPAAAEPARPAQGAIEDALVQLKAFMRTLPTPARDSRTEEALIEAGIAPELAHEIDQAVRTRGGRPTVVPLAWPSATKAQHAGGAATDTAAEMASRFEVRAGLERVTALVGPPGAGKTTTLVKLAVLEGLQRGRGVRLISADTQRIGGAEQLRTFATILGAPFQAVESMGALARAIGSAPAGELVLIDTPGYSEALQRELGGDLADFLSSRQDIDTHLVLTSSTSAAVLRKLVEQHRVYRPAKLLFTRLDEVESLATVYCEAVKQKMPLSYFGTGQAIPEDVEGATKERVTDSLVRRLREELLAVA